MLFDKNADKRMSFDVIKRIIYQTAQNTAVQGVVPNLIDLTQVIHSDELKHYLVSLEIEDLIGAMNVILNRFQQDEVAIVGLIEDLKLIIPTILSMGLYDPLTELLNLNGLLHQSRVIDELAKESELSIAIIAIDANNLRAANNFLPDRHAGGDRYLKILSQALTKWARPNQAIFRIGGDEFLAISIADSHTNPYEILERIELDCNTCLANTSLFSKEERDMVAEGCQSSLIFSISAGIVTYKQGMAKSYFLGGPQFEEEIPQFELASLRHIADCRAYDRKELLKKEYQFRR